MWRLTAAGWRQWDWCWCLEHIFWKSIKKAIGNLIEDNTCWQGSPHENHFRPSMLCRTFWSTAGRFSQLMTGKYVLHFLFSSSTFSVYWTLMDKMFGNVGALCRTSAKVCQIYLVNFARTGRQGLLVHYQIPSLIYIAMVAIFGHVRS